jgi:hypothetical protein
MGRWVVGARPFGVGISALAPCFLLVKLLATVSVISSGD